MSESNLPQRGSVPEVVAAFLKLGLISFGGPIAHLGYYREEFVERRKWLDDATYADLVALCQFLPGPASSQVVFALGMRRAGLAGAIAASFCFLLPSAVLMISFAYGVSALGDLSKSGWLHGLKIAAVAVVGQAVFFMSRSLCPDALRLGIALIAAAALMIFPGALVQVSVIAAGAFAGWLFYRPASVPAGSVEFASPRGHRAALAALVLFGVLLVVLPALAAALPWRWVAIFDSFYRSGALVFGGGHVVLPLLRAEVVPPGWIGDDAFLAGYGAAQAVPGPLFSFAGYLGAVIHGGPHAWLGGVLCLAAIFLPAWLLIGGALPFWHTFRSRRWAQAALRGANAAVVGVLLAALYRPVSTEAVHTWSDLVAAVVLFCLLTMMKAPSWSVVLLAAAAGQWLL